MNKRSLIFGILLVSVILKAQTESNLSNETMYTDPPTKESSSFVPDPDPLDPLPAKQENIKDGDEIVLDDIKQVLNSKVIKKKKNTPTNEQAETKSESTSEVKSKSVSKSASKARRKKKKNTDNLVDDSADQNLENKFHNLYQKFHSKPTSEQAWAQATSSQKVNEYSVQKGDTLYSISQMLFGDSEFWPKLWAVNRDYIFNPHIIKPGLKIYIYSGDAEHLPTLSLNQPSVLAQNSNQGSTEGVPGREDSNGVPKNFRQWTELDRLQNNSNHKWKDEELPQGIPDSLPEYRNNLFNKNAQNTVFSITPIEYNDQFVVKNPYVLSPEDIQSDFVVPKKQIHNLICREKQYVGQVEIEKNKKPAVPGDYYIVEKIEPKKSQLNSTYKYRIVGSVKVNDKQELRISDCQQLFSASTILVSAQELQGAKAPTEVIAGDPTIIDGLDFQKQQLFDLRQMVVINAENLRANEGDELSIYSDRLGQTVGKVQIIKKTGTLAIGTISRVSEQIERGDRVIDMGAAAVQTETDEAGNSAVQSAESVPVPDIVEPDTTEEDLKLE